MKLRYLILLKTLAIGVIPSSHPNTNDQTTLTEFIEKETSIAWQGILNNIGADGALVQGAHPGIVVASPSKSNPDYFYTWTRDAGLTIPAIVARLTQPANDDHALDRILQQYATSQATQQAISNPSGSLTDGTGLGEPKFHVNLTEFTSPWGRPQRDGPPLRASALIAYGNHLLTTGQTTTLAVASNLWPIVRNDLAYVTQYWNESTFDLWEEVRGSSFFTTAVQHKALVEGEAFAHALGEDCRGCAHIAPQILCHLQEYWDGGARAVRTNLPTSGRSGLDANSILAAVHTFDPEAPCSLEDRGTFQPCSSRALANHKAFVDSFRALYGVNRGRGVGTAAAVGRYAEDVYQGGHPWYLTTLAAGEQLYDALYQWDRQGVIAVTAVSLPFFRDLVPGIIPGSYFNSSDEYVTIRDAVRQYADGFLLVVQEYTPEGGGLAEQFDRDIGRPVSAVDLTWSFAAFLTATARRRGEVPPSWGALGAGPAPAPCRATSIPGHYATPVVGSWRVHDELR
ncbi:glycoside hydrolase family 15 protein [Aspergillus saccharolyticus JOP 1030-1]|uniref:glucan 1,4-alpha-glucosidase n=1 Tax=Aspergillus saccharolyticus JOP 1030-1 TaxID=1450539 RepID=A0A318ZJG4_9EURO|nr:putative glucoamylase precursor [Aspergillus saccharolyticus JOP 1030-1]PYH46524.1 putative glucoamylase precursor [Aspergillus saccharolyticus JOP 1030-1]